MRTPASCARDAAPETPSQAKTWDKIKSAYLAAGLCHRCAALAAYGHQLGFHSLVEDWGVVLYGVRPKPLRPCEACAPIVAAFPNRKPNGWRGIKRPRPAVADKGEVLPLRHSDTPVQTPPLQNGAVWPLSGHLGERPGA